MASGPFYILLTLKRRLKVSYNNQHILLATKHKKEEAIRPVFESLLGCYIDVPDDYDTDKFGTFSGEVKRKKTARETCILKAKKAAKEYGYKYAIASEGSFVPHPQMFFLASNIEVLVFIDLERDIVIADFIISTKTNNSHIDLTIGDDYSLFLERASFPSHGLIVRELVNNGIIEKGICDNKALLAAMSIGFKQSEKIRLETDMRAMMNPTRMMVINELSNKLVTRIQTLCPACQAPGFGEISTVGELPCKCCGGPTTLYEKIVLNCVKCKHKIYRGREDGLTRAKPNYCDFCNP